jgi:hypothetical protein
MSWRDRPEFCQSTRYGACMVGTLAAGLVLKLGVKKKIPAMAMGARPGATWMTQNGRDS